VKYLKILFIILVMILMSTDVTAKEGSGCKLTIVNQTSDTYIAMVYWLDHPFLKETFGRPFNIVGAEMQPGESFNGSYDVLPGKFYVEVWKLRTVDKQVVKYFSIEPDVHKLTIHIDTGDKGPIIAISKNGVYWL